MAELEGAEHDRPVSSGQALVLDGVGGGDQCASAQAERSYAGNSLRGSGERRPLLVRLLRPDHGVDRHLQREPRVAHLQHLSDQGHVGVGEAAVAGGRALAAGEPEPVLPGAQHPGRHARARRQHADAEPLRDSVRHVPSSESLPAGLVRSEQITYTGV